jgi:hypothetical protein
MSGGLKLAATLPAALVARLVSRSSMEGEDRAWSDGRAPNRQN